MLGFAMLIPLLLLLLLIWFVMRPKNRVRFQLSKKFIYTLVGAYVIILLIATVTAEIYDKKFAAELPDIIEDNPYSENFHSMDPASIIEKRNHVAGDRLILKKSNHDYGNNVDIVIKRKMNNDGVIEETIYKPALVNDGLDFSDRFQFTLPEWNGNTVFFPRQPETIIKYASYRDASLLNQFATQPRTDANLRSYSGMSRSITVYLLVPKDIVIDADEELYVNYIDA